MDNIDIKYKNLSEISFLNCKRNFTATEAEELLYTSADKWTVKIGIPTILSFGLIGNLSFLFVLYRALKIRSGTMKQMVNETNFYLANLAIADFCYLLVAGTRYLIDVFQTPFNLDFTFHSKVGCAMPTFIVYATYFASVWLITLVAMERYLGICKTFEHRRIRSKRRSVSLVVVVWLVSLLMAGFSLPSWITVLYCMERPFDQPLFRVHVCEFTCKWCELFLILLDGGQFMFAFILNSFLYTKIIQTLRSRPESSRSRIDSTASNVSKNESSITTIKGHPVSRSSSKRSLNKETSQVAKMLTVNALIFFWCLFPFAIVNNTNAFLVNRSGDGFLDSKWYGWYGKMLSLVNSAVNPYIYSIFNTRYRLAFGEAFSIRKNTHR